jgi:hypothetical protein
MDHVIVEAQEALEVSCEPTKRDVRELSDLCLALVGGGCGETVAA